MMGTACLFVYSVLTEHTLFYPCAIFNFISAVLVSKTCFIHNVNA